MTQRFCTSVFVLAAAVCALAAAPGSGYAQETGGPLAGGAWALQFQVNDNFTLSSFEGSVVSLKRHYSPNTALRLGVSLSLRTTDNGYGVVTPDTTFSRNTDQDYYNLGFDLQYLHYMRPGSKVTPFVGVGPSVGYVRNKAVQEDGNDEVSVTDKSWFAGLSGLLGVEWFPSSTIGIHAEYSVSARYTKGTSDRENPLGAQTSESKSWSMNGRSVLFGLSVYF